MVSLKVMEIPSFKTSDGKIFENLQKAQAHEAEWQFFNWCRNNICRGGEWDADMVANAIWEKWGETIASSMET